jgi:hypothetical protein
MPATRLADLPDTAFLRIIPSEPALDQDQGDALMSALDKLFVQFAKEGRIDTWAIEKDPEGPFLLAAWCSADLSGCSKDKIAQVLALHEERTGAALLAPPPLAVLDGAVTRFFGHKTFAEAVRSGSISSDTLAWDTLAADLGAWRSGRVRPVAEHWLAPLYQRASAH